MSKHQHKIMYREKREGIKCMQRREVKNIFFSNFFVFTLDKFAYDIRLGQKTFSLYKTRFRATANTLEMIDNILSAAQRFLARRRRRRRHYNR